MSHRLLNMRRKVGRFHVYVIAILACHSNYHMINEYIYTVHTHVGLYMIFHTVNDIFQYHSYLGSRPSK